MHRDMELSRSPSGLQSTLQQVSSARRTNPSAVNTSAMSAEDGYARIGNRSGAQTDAPAGANGPVAESSVLEEMHELLEEPVEEMEMVSDSISIDLYGCTRVHV